MQSEGHLLFVYNNQAAVSTICILKQPCVLEIKKKLFFCCWRKNLHAALPLILLYFQFNQ